MAAGDFNNWASLAIAVLAFAVSLLSLRVSRMSARASLDSARADQRQALAAEASLEAEYRARSGSVRTRAALQLLTAHEELIAAIDHFRRKHVGHAGQNCTGVPMEIEEARRSYEVALGVNRGLLTENIAEEDEQIRIDELLETPSIVLHNVDVYLNRGSVAYEQSGHGRFSGYQEMYCALACAIMDATDFQLEISSYLQGVVGSAVRRLPENPANEV